MKYPTVSSLCEGIAESIRRKEGSTELINPQDFAERIEALQSGSGGESGGLMIEYLDVSAYSNIEGIEQLFLMFSILAKYDTTGYGAVIASPFITKNINIEKQFKAVMIDFTMQMVDMGRIGTIKESLIAQGFTQEDIDSIPRLTKEQFYSLE